MACFVAPAAMAAIATGVRKKVPAKYHIEWLIAMLWGGVVMLVIDHIMNGEIVFYPPFLTALKNPTDIATMMKEIVTVGGAMTAAVFVIWSVMILIQNVRKSDAMSENRT